jgi:hypothetical protein
MRNTNRFPKVLAGSAIGGAIGLLLASDSGRRFIHAVRHMDATDWQNKIEDARVRMEHTSRTLTDKFRGVCMKAQGAIDAGRHVYQESLRSPRVPLNALEAKNKRIATTVHDAVDGMSRNVRSFGESLGDPFYEFKALVQGIRRGVHNLTERNEQARRMERPQFMGRRG